VLDISVESEADPGLAVSTHVTGINPEACCPYLISDSGYFFNHIALAPYRYHIIRLGNKGMCVNNLPTVITYKRIRRSSLPLDAMRPQY